MNSVPGIQYAGAYWIKNSDLTPVGITGGLFSLLVLEHERCQPLFERKPRVTRSSDTA